MGADLAPLLVGGGVFGVLAFTIIYLLRALDTLGSRADERIDAANRRADDATTRHRETQLLLEQAREARHAAEDRAAAGARELRDLREEVKELRTEVEALRAQLGQPGGGL